mmetsp:Transcript_3990/g.12267  ORF Transcript_3990/g.12267 Transcript_3990/m.12267 type:complete len:369 (+) Transcript_3990:19-1125(+)
MAILSLLISSWAARASADELRPFRSLGIPSEFATSSSKRKPYRLAIRRWPATGPSKATVVLQHGGGWHSGYFGGLGTALGEAGYEVVAMDAMGHGFSEGPGGKTQWEHLRVVRDDLRRLVANQTAPVVLLGESMGSVIVTPLALEGAVDALVISGGLFRLAPATSPPKPALAVLTFAGWVLPKLRVRLPSMNATFDSAFGDPRWAAAARADENIVVDAFFLGPMAQVLPEMRKLRNRAPALSCPLLVMHSKIDTRTDVAAAAAFYDAAASQDKDLILYDDASHQLYQDSPANIARATTDLIAWLDRRFAPTAADEEPASAEGEDVEDDAAGADAGVEDASATDEDAEVEPVESETESESSSGGAEEEL